MESLDWETATDRYLRAVSRPDDDRYQLSADQLLWLIQHSTRLGGQRLELLRALQSALPKSGEPGPLADLKELLTDLIIMQSRLAEREERLGQLLHQLIDARLLDRVPVDEDLLRKLIQEILQSSEHVRMVAGDEG